MPRPSGSATCAQPWPSRLADSLTGPVGLRPGARHRSTPGIGPASGRAHGRAGFAGTVTTVGASPVTPSWTRRSPWRVAMSSRTAGRSIFDPLYEEVVSVAALAICAGEDPEQATLTFVRSERDWTCRTAPLIADVA